TLCRVSDLPDLNGDNQIDLIVDKIMEIKKELSVGQDVKTGYEITVGDVIDEYLKYCKNRNEKNVRGKEGHLRFWSNAKNKTGIPLGQILLHKISASDIRTAKSGLVTQAGKTINEYLNTLKNCLKYATQNYDDFEDNPVLLVAREQIKKSVHRELSDEERERLMEQLKIRTSEDPTVNKWYKKRSKTLRAVVLFGIWIGCRRGELRALWWNNIDWKKETITFTHALRNNVWNHELGKYENNVRTAGLKNGDPERTISFRSLPVIRDLLLQLWDGHESNWIFGETDFRTSWERLLECADIKNFRFHDLRHTVGSYLFQTEGMTLADIAHWLGHDSEQSTKIYAKKDIKVSDKVGEALTKRMG
ncbi:MAG: site-specific integrase, partial [Candidatus Marinimicrobia bacterium]|nr:site-specific integrase [Candidatus Neomarinimicrobiota bacterium]